MPSQFGVEAQAVVSQACVGLAEGIVEDVAGRLVRVEDAGDAGPLRVDRSEIEPCFLLVGVRPALGDARERRREVEIVQGMSGDRLIGQTDVVSEVVAEIDNASVGVNALIVVVRREASEPPDRIACDLVARTPHMRVGEGRFRLEAGEIRRSPERLEPGVQIVETEILVVSRETRIDIRDERIATTVVDGAADGELVADRTGHDRRGAHPSETPVQNLPSSLRREGRIVGRHDDRAGDGVRTLGRRLRSAEHLQGLEVPDRSAANPELGCGEIAAVYADRRPGYRAGQECVAADERAVRVDAPDDRSRGRAGEVEIGDTEFQKLAGRAGIRLVPGFLGCDDRHGTRGSPERAVDLLAGDDQLVEHDGLLTVARFLREGGWPRKGKCGADQC